MRVKITANRKLSRFTNGEIINTGRDKREDKLLERLIMQGEAIVVKESFLRRIINRIKYGLQ